MAQVPKNPSQLHFGKLFELVDVKLLGIKPTLEINKIEIKIFIIKIEIIKNGSSISRY